jgi:hypothetical protein
VAKAMRREGRQAYDLNCTIIDRTIDDERGIKGSQLGEKDGEE